MLKRGKIEGRGSDGNRKGFDRSGLDGKPMLDSGAAWAAEGGVCRVFRAA